MFSSGMRESHPQQLGLVPSEIYINTFSHPSGGNGNVNVGGSSSSSNGDVIMVHSGASDDVLFTSSNGQIKRYI